MRVLRPSCDRNGMLTVITRYRFNVTMAERLNFPDILRYSILLQKEWTTYSFEAKMSRATFCRSVAVAPDDRLCDDPKTMTTVLATTRHPCILPNRAVEPAKSRRCLLCVCDITLV